MDLSFSLTVSGEGVSSLSNFFFVMQRSPFAGCSEKNLWMIVVIELVMIEICGTLLRACSSVYNKDLTATILIYTFYFLYEPSL